MILAVQRLSQGPPPETLEQIESVKSFCGIREHCLETLLRQRGALPRREPPPHRCDDHAGAQPRAFVLLLVLATMFGGNHVARLCIDHGVNVLAVAVAQPGHGSSVVALIVVVQGCLALRTAALARVPLIGALVAVPEPVPVRRRGPHPGGAGAAGVQHLSLADGGSRPMRATAGATIAVPLITTVAAAQGPGGTRHSCVALGVPLAALAAAVFGWCWP